jgi:hypothetical protein
MESVTPTSPAPPLPPRPPPQFALALRKPPSRAGARVAQSQLVRQLEEALAALEPEPHLRLTLTPLPSVDSPALLFGVPPLSDGALHRHCGGGGGGGAPPLSTPSQRLAAAHDLLKRAVTLTVPVAGTLDAVSAGGLAAAPACQRMSLGDATALSVGPFAGGGVALLPLHDPAQLAAVRSEWLGGGSLWRPRRATPPSVAAYFGPDVYEYAEFQRTLTAALLPAAAAGAALAMWRALQRTPHRVDDAAGAAFALGLAVWGSLVTRVWARRQRTLYPAAAAAAADAAPGDASAGQATAPTGGGGGGTRGVLDAAAQLVLLTLPVLGGCLAGVATFIACCEAVRVLTATELAGRDDALLTPGAGGKLAAGVLVPAVAAAVAGAPPGVAVAGGGAATAKRLLLRAARVSGLTAASLRRAAAHSKPLQLLLQAGGSGRTLDTVLMHVPLWAVLPRWAAAALGQASLALYLLGTPVLTRARQPRGRGRERRRQARRPGRRHRIWAAAVHRLRAARRRAAAQPAAVGAAGDRRGAAGGAGASARRDGGCRPAARQLGAPAPPPPARAGGGGGARGCHRRRLQRQRRGKGGQPARPRRWR